MHAGFEQEGGGAARRDAGVTHVVLLGIAALYFLLWPVWRAFFPMEVAPNEGWDAYNQDRALQGVLYPSTDSLIINNYPPLSFYLIGWLGRLFGDSLYVGRAVSILAVFVLAITIALIVRRFGGGRVAAAVAGIWFVCVMAGAFNRFVGMNDPHILANAVMTLALLWFLARDGRGASVVWPVLLMVVAGFIKHSIIMVPVATLLWLVLRDGVRAWPPVVAGAGAAALGLVLCVAVYGDLFIANMLTDRHYFLMRAISGLGRLQWVLPALVIAVVWVWLAWRTWVAQFLALMLGVGFVAYVVQWSGEAVLDNAQFDLLIATAIAVGLAYEGVGVGELPSWWSLQRARLAIVTVLLLRIMATGRFESALLIADPAYRALYWDNAVIVTQEIARVAAVEGDVYCSNKLVCRWAGKPYAGDDFRIEQLIYTGKHTHQSLAELMKQRSITFVQVDPRTEAPALSRDWIDYLKTRPER